MNTCNMYAVVVHEMTVFMKTRGGRAPSKPLLNSRWFSGKLHIMYRLQLLIIFCDVIPQKHVLNCARASILIIKYTVTLWWSVGGQFSRG